MDGIGQRMENQTRTRTNGDGRCERTGKNDGTERVVQVMNELLEMRGYWILAGLWAALALAVIREGARK